MVTAAVDSGVVTEGPLSAMTATGTIDFGDVDLADAHVTSVTPGGSGYLGTFAANVADDSTGDGSGQVSWLFLATNQLRQSLQVGQQLVQTYTVEIDDGHGGTASQLVTITINGTNNAAVISGDTRGVSSRPAAWPTLFPASRSPAVTSSPPTSTTRTISGRRLALRPQAPTATAATR